ncbi:hypothetical protein [Vibrio caribbeanicus]|uniref:hypothetical protein n=1 Tax=Vibrio caribbeanicus TaxID=701175 RepID=UPI0030DBE85E
MSDTKRLLLDKFKDRKFSASHCRKAVDSFYDSLVKVPKSKGKSLERQMVIQLQRLARGDRMSSESFAPEGMLPKASKHKKFYALKRLPIRGYCWQSTNVKSTYFVSHYISKDFQKLREKDTTKVHKNWYRIEEYGHEC